MKFFIYFFLIIFSFSCAHSKKASTSKNRGLSAASPEKDIRTCGPHPYQDMKDLEDFNANSGTFQEDLVAFKEVNIGVHGFILHPPYSEGSGTDKKYFVKGTHFSNAFPRHLFSALAIFNLTKDEFDFIKKVFAEHPGTSPEGMFAPFMVLSRVPMTRANAGQNNTRGFCMKDFEKIAVGGQRQKLYGGPNRLIGNLRKWRSSRPVFSRYSDISSSDGAPYIDLELADPSAGTKGDIEITFFHPHKPIEGGFEDSRFEKRFDHLKKSEL